MKNTSPTLVICCTLSLIVFVVLAINNQSVNGIINSSEIIWKTFNDNNNAVKFNIATDGITFQIPAAFTIGYNNPYGGSFHFENETGSNKITFSLPNEQIQSLAQQYPNMVEMMNQYASIAYGTKVIEPFSEKSINGFPAVIGKISQTVLEDSTASELESTMIMLMHNGQFYGLQYSDEADKINNSYNQEILDRLLLSFQIE